MKTYPLEPSPATRVQWLVPPILALLFPILVVLMSREKNGPPWPLAVIPLAMGTALLLLTLRMPTRIEVSDDGAMEWIAPLRRIRVLPSEVLAIAPDRRGQGYFLLTHGSGRFRFLNQFTGFHELLTDLKRANPSVELRGC